MKYALFAAIALLISLPWFFQPGYLFFLDWQGTPTIPALALDPTGGISGLPVQLLLHAIAFITGPAPAQKIIVFLMLAAAGYGTALLVQKMLQEKTLSFPAYIAGIFAMLNPFIYNRIHMGHIYLLAAYALTPFAIAAFLRFLQQPSIKNGLFAGIMSSLVLFMSIHHVILLPILLVLFAWQYTHHANISFKQYSALLAPILTSIIVILTVAATQANSPLHYFTKEDLRLFAPVAQCSKSVLLDTALLASEWRNPIITQAPCASPVFFAAGILLLCIMVVGAASHKRLALGALALILLARFPIIPAMRDSAKFLADLALVQSILLAYGIVHIPKIAALILVCIIGLPFAWGLHGTVSAKEYPASWYEFNTALAHSEDNPTVLFLPWHLYMPFDFTNKATIGNPAKNFFSHANILQGDNSEMRQGEEYTTTQSSSALLQSIENTLHKRNINTFPQTFQDLLKENHIEYVALAHGSPEQTEYTALFNTLSYLQPYFDKEGLTVWQFAE